MVILYSYSNWVFHIFVISCRLKGNLNVIFRVNNNIEMNVKTNYHRSSTQNHINHHQMKMYWWEYKHVGVRSYWPILNASGSALIPICWIESGHICTKCVRQTWLERKEQALTYPWPWSQTIKTACLLSCFQQLLSVVPPVFILCSRLTKQYNQTLATWSD